MTEGLRLAGRRVGITADRRWRAQADLLKNQGAEVLHGPTIRTVDLSGDQALRRATLARVALQLFAPAGHRSTAALAECCRELVEVPVYRWLMPADPGPARRLVAAACEGTVDAVTFTSQPAVHHLFRIAEELGRAGELR